MPVDLEARVWRDALLATLRRVPEHAVLALSAGMDSATLLAGLLALGRRPECITLRVEGEESEDRDAASALAGFFDLRLTEAVVPRNLTAVWEDAAHVIEETGNPRKTAVQCCHGLLYVIWAMGPREAGRGDLILGTGGIVEDNRASKLLAARLDEPDAREELERRRRENLLGGDPTSATETMKRFAASRGVTAWEPYSMAPLAEAGLRIPYERMNAPRQKGIALRAFPDFFGDPENPSWWRPNSSLQVNVGIRVLHDRLLLDPEINPRGSKAVVALYNAELRRQRSGQRSLI